VQVLDGQEHVVFSGPTDYQGSRVVRNLIPGDGYVVRLADDPSDYTDSIKVLSLEGSLPDESFYAEQQLGHGYQYIRMRDGVLLSTWISLPGPPEEGPYPTIIEYSGYSPSRPGQSLGPDVEFLCGMYPILCEAPEFPTGLILGLLGYAVVGVNIRGTGCSGGPYDYFEPLQLTDGYDVVEIVARQPWVKHNKVGLVGLSYPGIAQLFVASTRPPSLAAISPFSVIASSNTTLVPGGILNDGFAMQWIEMVLDKANPYGHGWIRKLVEGGDTICEEHQLLHSQKVDVIQKAYDNPYYEDDVAGPLDPRRFVDRIEVPVFLVGQTQDEQTGPHFPVLFPLFDSAPVRRFNMTNGVHPDGFSPQILAEWVNFVSFYVAREIPRVSDEFYFLVPMFMEMVFGAKIDLPAGRFDEFDDFHEALAAYESEPDLRVIFESGAHPDVTPGAPQGTFHMHFAGWPIPGTEPDRWFFHADGSLQKVAASEDGGASSFLHDAEAGQRVTLAGGSIDKPQPNWDWRQPEPGKALSFVTPPLEGDHVYIGHTSVDLWLKSTEDDADLEACISEVRPDGKETYIICGWLRARHRELLPESSELQPTNSYYEWDVEPLLSGEWNPIRIEVMPFAHIFRAGSRVRIVVDTPGDSMASWRFAILDGYNQPPVHTVAHQAAYPSSVVLPLIPSVEVPTALPPCHALRGQPCRDYVPYVNTPSDAGAILL
jgi:hypothetical protein